VKFSCRAHLKRHIRRHEVVKPKFAVNDERISVYCSV